MKEGAHWPRPSHFGAPEREQGACDRSAAVIKGAQADLLGASGLLPRSPGTELGKDGGLTGKPCAEWPVPFSALASRVYMGCVENHSSRDFHV